MLDADYLDVSLYRAFNPGIVAKTLSCSSILICFNSLHLYTSLGFPVQTGRVSLIRRVKSAETACKVVKFPPFSFYPDKEVHVQITTDHWNISKKNFIHDATVSWVETVNFENFEVNILKEVFNSSIASSSN